MKHKFQLFFLAIVVCFITLVLKCYIDSRPIIVFIGGGSAKNFINDLFMNDQKIENYPGSFYINVPSGSAWLTLVEEINRYDHSDDKKKKSTAIVCLSADAIDSDTTFMNKGHNKDIFTKKRIVGIELGADEMTVYLRGSIDNLSNTISVKTLESIIKKDSVKIYTTKPESGTLNAYKRIIKDSATKKKLDSISRNNVFYGFFTEKDFEKDSNCLILGSQYYKPNVGSLKPIEISDTTNIKKPICIYFATYPDDRGFYRINEPIRKFIRSFKSKINKDVWNKIENSGNWQDAAEQLSHNKNGSILYLNDKLQYIKPYKTDTVSRK